MLLFLSSFFFLFLSSFFFFFFFHLFFHLFFFLCLACQGTMICQAARIERNAIAAGGTRQQGMVASQVMASNGDPDSKVRDCIALHTRPIAWH